MGKRVKMDLLFFVRKNRVLKSGEVSIHLRITVSGRSTEAAAGISIAPDLWSGSSHMATGTSRKAKTVNNHIENIKTEIYEHYRTMIIEKKDITAIALKNAWLGIEEKQLMILEIFQEHNKNVKALIGIDYSGATHQRYETSLSLQNLPTCLTSLEIRLLRFFAFAICCPTRTRTLTP